MTKRKSKRLEITVKKPKQNSEPLSNYEIISPEEEELFLEESDLSQISTQDILQAKNCIQGRLSGNNISSLVRLDDQYAKLSCGLNRVINFRVSGSLLLIGPRGSGKTLLLDTVLKELNSTPAFQEKHYYVIRLNGLIQTDDKIALREIVRQLRLEIAFQNNRITSFSECLDLILYSLLHGSTKKNIPLIFILEEMDLFAQHPKQSLLYALLDATQSGACPIFVVGTTSKLDILDMFEKRVKSRFSHQCLYLYPPDKSMNLIDIATSCLQLTTADAIQNSEYISAFNQNIKILFTNKSVLKIVNYIFDTSRDVRVLKTILMTACSHMKSNNPFILAEDIVKAADDHFSDLKSKLISSLSVLELCLLVAVKRLLARQMDEFNFDMVFEEYREFTQQMSTWGRSINLFFVKPVAHKAFERLLELNMVKYSDGATAKGPKEHRMVKCLLTRDGIETAVKKYSVDAPDAVLKWAES